MPIFDPFTNCEQFKEQKENTFVFKEEQYSGYITLNKEQIEWNFTQFDETFKIDRYVPQSDIPKWFQDLLEKAPEILHQKDRLPNLMKG